MGLESKISNSWVNWVNSKSTNTEDSTYLNMNKIWTKNTCLTYGEGKDYYRAPECYIPSSQTCPGLRVQAWLPGSDITYVYFPCLDKPIYVPKYNILLYLYIYMIHIYIYMYAYVCMYMYMYMHTYMYVGMYIDIYIYRCVCLCICICICKYIYRCICVYIYICICVYIYIYICMYVYVYMYVCMYVCVCMYVV